MTGNEREAFLQRACAGDGEILTEVRELLEFASADDGFLRPAEPGAALALLESMALPRPGDDLGGFRVLGVLASLGMGVVFKARQENPSRVVALKMIRRGFADDEARRRFRREIEVLARLRHPGIAQVYASGVLDEGSPAETPWYAMELVEAAKPLATYAHDQGLTMRQRVQRFQRVCDAVHHGHQRGVIHRGLRSENVLVDTGGHVKVIDFGVARARRRARVGVARDPARERARDPLVDESRAMDGRPPTPSTRAATSGRSASSSTVS